MEENYNRKLSEDTDLCLGLKLEEVLQNCHRESINYQFITSLI